MRDGMIFKMQEAAAVRDALLLRQTEFLRTRQQALEEIVLHSTFVDRLRLLWDPRRLKAALDARQKQLIAEGEERLRQAQEKRKIEVVKAAPGLVKP